MAKAVKTAIKVFVVTYLVATGMAFALGRRSGFPLIRTGGQNEVFEKVTFESSK